MAAGVDLAPLLEGLENDLCQAPHWGHIVQGALTVTYRDGSEERVSAGDLFHWPPGHTVRVDEDAEFLAACVTLCTATSVQAGDEGAAGPPEPLPPLPVEK